MGALTIAATVAWYDEPPELLERCLLSLVGAVDYLVIADGRWDLFEDDAPALSTSDQRRTVARAKFELERAGISSFDLDRESVWPSQVAKRSRLYSFASRLADWTLVLDADEHVEHADRPRLNELLTATDRLTGMIGGRTVFGPSAPNGTFPYPRLFSSAAGRLYVEGSHNGVRAANTDLWLTGDPAYVPLAETFDATAHLRIYHDQGASRPHERELADRRYRRARRVAAVEGWPRRAGRA